MAAELHALARQLDPKPSTMGASNQDDDFNRFTDLIAFNKYFGWYGDNMDDMGRWIDREHAAHPGGRWASASMVPGHAYSSRRTR